MTSTCCSVGERSPSEEVAPQPVTVAISSMNLDCIEGLCFPNTLGGIDPTEFGNTCEVICGYPTCNGKFWERFPVD